MRFTGFGPENAAESTVFDALQGLQEFGSIDQVLQVSVEDARFFDSFQHTPGLRSIASQRFGGHDPFAVFAAEQDRYLMKVVRQRNTDQVDAGVGNSLLHLCRKMAAMVVVGEFFRALSATGIYTDNGVTVAFTKDGIGIETGNEAGAEHGYVRHGCSDL